MPAVSGSACGTVCYFSGCTSPYHTDVFVLTHHARDPVTMEGGTTFYFVTDGIHAALELAKASAKGGDVRVGGGAATIRQYLEAGLIDEMHIAVSPVLLGAGENLRLAVGGRSRSVGAMLVSMHGRQTATERS